MYKLSKSSIGLIKECPRCFWLTNHKIWKRPQGITMSLPSGMDRIIKVHFDKFRNKGELPPEICKNSHCNGMKLFDDIAKLNEWRNNFKGIRFSDKDGNVLFGAVDDILVNKDKMIVLDYKTRGFPLKEDTSGYYQDQLDIYNFLLKKNNYKTEDYGFLLFYHPNKVLENGEVLFNAELIKMKVSVENAEKLWKETLKCLNEECPEKRCGWCVGVEDG